MPWLFCSIVVVISILYLFSPENIISGQIEVTTRSLLTIHKSAKVKRGITRKISKNKTVEPSKMSRNETVEPSKISKNKRVEPLKKSKNKTVEPPDDSEYQSEYIHHTYVILIATLQSKYNLCTYMCYYVQCFQVAS